MKINLMAAVLLAASFAQPALAGGHALSGMASFYGSESGSHTASGARFRPHGLTAAHRTLPFGTVLRCVHRGRAVVVTVNDRGPAKWTRRFLDLSRGAATVIGMIGAGVGHVVCEVAG